MGFDKIFIVIFAIMFITALGFIIFTFVTMFNPNARSKWIGRQLKMQKKILEDNKDTIKDIQKLGGEVSIDSYNEILDDKEEVIKKNMDRTANASSGAITNIARAIKEGLDNDVYCKHCGAKIDSDSKFCKSCGKKVIYENK